MLMVSSGFRGQGKRMYLVRVLADASVKGAKGEPIPELCGSR